MSRLFSLLLRMIRQAGAAVVVALNKMDKPGADPEATKKQLKEEGIHLDDFGGDVQVNSEHCPTKVLGRNRTTSTGRPV